MMQIELPAAVDTPTSPTASPQDRKAQGGVEVEAIRQRILSDPFTEDFILSKSRQLCRRKDFSRSDCDDLQQSMRLHLMNKAHLFNSKRGNVEAFVTRILTIWAAMAIRRRKCPKHMEAVKALSLEETSVEQDGQNIGLGDSLSEEDGQRRLQTYPISSLEHVEIREAVEFVMGNLSPEERALLTSVAENGVRATAKAMGTSWFLVKKEVKRLRSHFEKAGLGKN